MVSKEHLLHVVRDVDPDATLDDEAGELLMLMANEFIEGVIDGSARLAKHRNASAVDTSDVALFLDKQWQMKIPGFGEQSGQAAVRTPAGRK
jgi:transcription initiation factor TFIID subunit 12